MFSLRLFYTSRRKITLNNIILKKKLRQLSRCVTIYNNFTYASENIVKEHLYEVLSQSNVENPEVSLIIPFFRSADTVIKLIDKLVRLNFPIKCEIIMIDDGSDDNTSEIIAHKYHGVITLIKLNTNFGPAVARNIGVRLSKGKILFFLDSDEYISDIKVFKEIIEHTNDKTVVSYLVKKESGEPITWPLKFPNITIWFLSLFLPRRFYKGVMDNIPHTQQIVHSDWAGINFAIKKSVFPFFEERYYGEDIDLFKRLHIQGIKHIFINKCPVIIFNRGIQPKTRIGKARYTLFQAKIVYTLRYFPAIKKELFLTILLLWALIMSLLELLTYKPNDFFKSRFFYRLGAFGLHKLWFW